MTKSLSGTNDTDHLSEASQLNGCPCGRSHPDTRKWSLKPPRSPAFDRRTKERVYDALVAGKATAQAGFATVDYAGTCTRPLSINIDTFDHTHVTWKVRCRRCPECLRARQGYWAAAAHRQTLEAAAKGLRTWFGTLTFTAEAQRSLDQRAFEVAAKELGLSAEPGWWSDQHCDFKFAFLREQAVAELQKYWKRLRKAGHRFKYLAVIERHKSGLPHVHWLLHEVEAPVRKRELQRLWPFGFTKVVIVGGRSKRSASPAKAAWYVVKYLSKDYQSRQLASRLYRPAARKKRAATPLGKAERSEA